MKILYGEAYPDRETFDERLKIKGSTYRIARKGKEWFLLDSKFRITHIGSSKEEIHGAYRNHRLDKGVGRFRLHNIESFNEGRCSRARSKEIYDANKPSDG